MRYILLKQFSCWWISQNELRKTYLNLFPNSFMKILSQILVFISLFTSCLGNFPHDYDFFLLYSTWMKQLTRKLISQIYQWHKRLYKSGISSLSLSFRETNYRSLFIYLQLGFLHLSPSNKIVHREECCSDWNQHFSEYIEFNTLVSICFTMTIDLSPFLFKGRHFDRCLYS